MKWHLVSLGCVLAMAIGASAQANPASNRSLDGKYGTLPSANQPETHIVITIGSGDRTACGSRFNLSRVGMGDGFDFPKPGSGRSTDFPSPSGSYSSLGYPAAMGSTREFQLPAAVPSPDVVGCVDAQRNILYLTIHPRVLYKTAPKEPTPPVYQPNHPRSVPPQLESTPGNHQPSHSILLPGQAYPAIPAQPSYQTAPQPASHFGIK
jgi:hypothetical protein